MRVVCPHCDAVASPASEPLASAVCGQCGKALFTGEPVALDEERFDRHLAGDLPIVADFWAQWCGPCLVMASTFDRAAAALEPRARFVKIDVDANAKLADRYQVREMPALVVFRDGKVVIEATGRFDQALIEQLLES